MNDRLRVLHAPMNICGQPLILSRTMRDLGHESTCLVFNERPYERGADRNLRLRDRPRWQRRPLQWGTFVTTLPRYDVFTFHFTASLLPDLRDLPVLKALGKTLVFRFYGSDIRRPLPGDDYAQVDGAQADFEARQRRVELIGRYADATIAGPNLQPFAPGSVYIPQAIDLEEYVPLEKPGGGPVKIVHSPSRRARKGTEHVVAAVERLRAEGLDVELVLVENLPHVEAKGIYARADIAVEQLLSGWHGVSAVEFMALGLPVVSFIKPEHQKRFPELPVVSATPDTLADVLRDLVRDPAARLARGRASRAYAEETFDRFKVARQYVELYRSLR